MELFVALMAMAVLAFLIEAKHMNNRWSLVPIFCALALAVLTVLVVLGNRSY
ncbi:MAG: hypothetical protein IPL79_19980 [Myxococcales bacterium]|nr:hypothetical protein [Myxococcales bacterium]